MADKAFLRTPRNSLTAEQHKRDSKSQRRNLRIAIRQLERAELYLVALYSLNLEDRQADASTDDLIQRLRSLRRYLSELKLTA
jgi:hypothetical protein